MASIFCAVSFIKTISNANKFIAGIAIYRAGDNEFVEYRFKAFRSEDTSLVGEIWKKQIALVIGQFAIKTDEINITINQYVPLNISSLGDEPSIYDLPIAPAFGVFTAPIQDPIVIKNSQGIFRLKRDVYNGVTTNQSSLSIFCKYPLHNRHANVKDATSRRPIFSVRGELITLAKFAFILCEMIEWNYPALSSNIPSYAETNTLSTSSVSSTPGPPSTSGPSTSKPSTSSEPPSPSNSSLPSKISSTPEQSLHPGPSSHIDKGKQPATLEKDTNTPTITTNNNFTPNCNTTLHEYSDQSDASE
ncbi:hypothetical protein C2G38_2228333 [Gigaspora rosea]|uniref:Uncharacterized protein n=1 Tax=Gigaspora rosea TaxID=44941 RepID=A0A397U0E4_9GLOM|nr:hypothetical protein C2G38_2228333 [Gigaspora rosea]